MRINHNIAALNTHRQLTAGNAAQSKSMEKLSSGLRINRAGDDAAGLAISEKMRGQIRGLDMASKNSQDGISLIQTAEGALNETHDILQRMRELAVQSANDTNTGDDRKEIQNEINQLTSEINRIGNTTEFNTQKVLDGGEAQRKNQVSNNTDNTETAKEATVAGGTIADLDFTTPATFQVNGENITVDQDYSGDLDGFVTALQGKLETALGADKVTVGKNEAGDGITLTSGEDIVLAGAGLTGVGLTAGTTEAVAEEDAGEGETQTGSFTATLQIGANKGQAFQINVADMRAVALGIAQATNNVDNTETAKEATVAGGTIADLDFTTPATFQVNGENITVDQDYSGDLDGFVTALQGKLETALGADKVTVGKNEAGDGITLTSSEDIVLAGAGLTGVGLTAGTTEAVAAEGAENNASTTFTTSNTVTDGTTSNLGEKALDVSTHANATSAIDILDKAIGKVSAERSKLGAYQNRLEHTINNLNTSSENLTAAESRIRDVDYAIAV